MKDLQEILKITTNAFSFAKEMMFALKDGIVNYDEYDKLSKDLKTHCEKNNIITEIENIKLF